MSTSQTADKYGIHDQVYKNADDYSKRRPLKFENKYQ